MISGKRAGPKNVSSVAPRRNKLKAEKRLWIFLEAQ